MPFKSKAQRRKFAALLVEGKISPETFEEWNQETGARKLPERVGPARKPASRPKKAESKKKSAKKKTVSRKKAATGMKRRSQPGM